MIRSTVAESAPPRTFDAGQLAGCPLENTLICSCMKPTMKHDVSQRREVSTGTGRGHYRPLRPSTGGRYEPLFHTAVGVCQSAGRDICTRVRERGGESAACPGADTRFGWSARLGAGTRVVHRGDTAACRRAPEKCRDPQKSASLARGRQMKTRMWLVVMSALVALGSEAPAAAFGGVRELSVYPSLQYFT